MSYNTNKLQESLGTQNQSGDNDQMRQNSTSMPRHEWVTNQTETQKFSKGKYQQDKLLVKKVNQGSPGDLKNETSLYKTSMPCITFSQFIEVY